MCLEVKNALLNLYINLSNIPHINPIKEINKDFVE